MSAGLPNSIILLYLCYFVNLSVSFLRYAVAVNKVAQYFLWFTDFGGMGHSGEIVNFIRGEVSMMLVDLDSQG